MSVQKICRLRWRMKKPAVANSSNYLTICPTHAKTGKQLLDVVGNLIAHFSV
jgi:hypothetical protein